MPTKIKDLIYLQYNRMVNMPLKALLDWKLTKSSRRTNQTRKSMNVAIRLRRTKKKDWRTKEYRGAIKAITYLRRVKRSKRNSLTKKGYTKKGIMLKNAGYDAKKR